MKIEELAEKILHEKTVIRPLSPIDYVEIGIRAGLKVGLKLLQDNHDILDYAEGSERVLRILADLEDIYSGRAELPEVEE